MGTKKLRTEHALALILAARAECDPRTARRALQEGPDVIRTLAVRERLEREMRDLGLPIEEAQ